MRPEQRDRVKRLYSGVQLETGGDLFESNEAFHHSKEVDVSLHTGIEGWWGLLLDGSGVSREAPAPF